MLRLYEKDGVEIDDASLGGRESQRSQPFVPQGKQDALPS